MALGRTIVMPVANPASVRPLLACVMRLADPDGSTIVPMTVVRPDAPADERAQAWQGLADAEEIARELGITARAMVVEAGQVSDGVLRAVNETDATLVVMGWRGRSSTSNVFGALIDSVVGRSAVPLAIVRLGTVPFQRVLLPVSADHLLPGGDRGLCLAVQLAERLAADAPEATTVLRTGPREIDLPETVEQLSDRVHHDPRRTDQAVAAFAGPEDLLVAAVPPTVSGLRSATTHLAWAAPDSTLLVAVDVGPTRESGLAHAVENAGAPAPARPSGDERDVRIVVTARLPEDRNITPEDLARVLNRSGTTEQVMAWWPAGDTRPHVRATVTVTAVNVNAAIAAVMVEVHDAPAFGGSEITYDVDRGGPDSFPVMSEDLAILDEDDKAPSSRL